MSTQERPPRSKKESETEEEPEKVISSKKQDIKKVEPLVSVDQHSEVQKPTLREIFENNVPEWVNKPWMFILPTHESHLKSWKESWRSLILDYTEHFNLHIINTTELIGEYPFNNTKIRKQIGKSQIDLLFNEMEEMGLASWLDETHILVRVYFKTLDQWKEIIVSFLFDKGYAAEVVTIFELQNMDQIWSNLPRNDFVQIFNTLTEEKRAKWADSNKDSIQFII